jgi:hypothetical protein
LRRLRRSESGQAAIEIMGSLGLIVLATLVMWQMMVVMWTFNQTSNAARTASRVAGRDGDARKAARNALSPVLRHHLKFEQDGEKATVHVLIPIVVPGIFSEDVRATRTAELPR